MSFHVQNCTTVLYSCASHALTLAGITPRQCVRPKAGEGSSMQRWSTLSTLPMIVRIPGGVFFRRVLDARRLFRFTRPRP